MESRVNSSFAAQSAASNFKSLPRDASQAQPLRGAPDAVTKNSRSHLTNTLSLVSSKLSHLLWLFLASGITSTALADGGFITEIGGGWKDFDTTSYLMQSDCKKAIVVAPVWPENPRGLHPYSCGGDNPVFIGWPLAWEFNNGNTRIGWFHQSQWFDGRGELHFDCLCASHRFRWADIFKRKKNR